MAILLLLITLTLSTTLDCPVVLSDGDESAAESIADSLHAEDSTAHKEFRKFILFSKDFTAQEVPCETPTAQVSWLKSIANTDNEMAFAAEATLSAIDDKQLTPTPLRWVEPDAKRGGQVEKYEEATQQKAWIYPVPAQNQVKVVNNHGPGIFALYDTYGRQLALINLESGTSDIPIAHIPAGYYIALLYSLNNQVQRSPLIIVR